jgi:hypothetical protein
MPVLTSKNLSRAVIVAALLLTLAAFAASDPYSGQWFVEKSNKSSEVQMTLRYERHSENSNYNSTNSFDLPLDKTQGLTEATLNSGGSHGQFRLVRSAGTFVCDGWFNGGKGSGTFTFETNPQFAAELQKRGVGAPTQDQQFRLAMGDASLEMVDTLKAAKYEFDVEDLIRTVNHGVSMDYIRDINGLGYHPSTLSGLIRLRDHGVTPEFVRAIQASGLKDLPAEEMVRLRDHGVSPEYIQKLSQFGITDLPAKSLIRLRDHGVDPDFIASIRKSGYNATPEELTRLRDHGVTPEFVQEVKSAGMNASAEDLSRMRDHGVSGGFIAEVRGAGLNASPEELERLRDHGVSADFIAEVRKAGFTNLTVHDLTKLRDHGVDASYLKLHGKGRTIEQVIRMHDTGGENDVL